MKQIEKRLRRADKIEDIGLFMTAAVAWFHAKESDNPQDLELWLRENKLKTHLVAGPKPDEVKHIFRVDYNNLGPDATKRVKTRNAKNEKLRYVLWAFMDKQCAANLAKVDGCYEDNFKCLRLTGHRV